MYEVSFMWGSHYIKANIDAGKMEIEHFCGSNELQKFFEEMKREGLEIKHVEGVLCG